MAIVGGDTWTFRVRGQEFFAMVEVEQGPDLSYLDLPENVQAREAYRAGEFQIMQLRVTALDDDGEGIEDAETTLSGMESWLSEDSFHEEARNLARELCKDVLLGPTPRERMTEEQREAVGEFVDYLESLNTLHDIRGKLTDFMDDVHGSTRGY